MSSRPAPSSKQQRRPGQTSPNPAISLSPANPSLEPDLEPAVVAVPVPVPVPVVIAEPVLPGTQMDVLDEIPLGVLHPNIDPGRPTSGYLVSRRDRWSETNAYRAAPDAMFVELTDDIWYAWYPMGAKRPSYNLVGRAGQLFPRPA